MPRKWLSGGEGGVLESSRAIIRHQSFSTIDVFFDLCSENLQRTGQNQNTLMNSKACAVQRALFIEPRALGRSRGVHDLPSPRRPLVPRKSLLNNNYVRDNSVRARIDRSRRVRVAIAD